MKSCFGVAEFKINKPDYRKIKKQPGGIFLEILRWQQQIMRQYAFYKEPKLFKICATVQSMGRGGGPYRTRDPGAGAFWKCASVDALPAIVMFLPAASSVLAQKHALWKALHTHRGSDAWRTCISVQKCTLTLLFTRLYVPSGTDKRHIP